MAAGTEWPLTGLAVLFLACYAVEVLYVSAPPAARDGLAVTLRITWALFIADYVVRFLLAVHKVRFVRHTPFDLAVVALPMLRPLRALRTAAQSAAASLAVFDARRDPPGLPSASRCSVWSPG